MHIRFDTWFSERSLHESGAVQKAIETLKAKDQAFEGVLPPPKGQVDPDYEARPQLLFRASAFGDDGDRTLTRSDGRFTYFAGDVAYHWDKLQRGFHRLVNIWGADHGGYVKRMKAAVQALSGRKDALDVILVQMVNLTRNGVPVKMSKRSGTFVALRDVVDELGTDSTRILFLLRRPDGQFDFDLELAKKHAPDNPVLYVQYGHARISGILRKAKELGHGEAPFDLAALQTLQMPEEKTLVRRVLAYPDLIERAAAAREPHRVIFYLQETCAEFHAYYTQGKVAGEKVIAEDPKKRVARMFLCQCLQTVLRNGLGLLGVTAPDRMEWGEEAE
jgi:arginyl-tRNA synthetase